MAFAGFCRIGSLAGRASRRGQRHRGGALVALATVAASIGGQAVFAQDAGKAADPTKLDLTKDHVLYMVGYSHLDTEWCWSYPQVIKEFLPNTLHDNFALFEKYPDYIFNWTGANRYRMMKDYYPDDYAKLKKYVAAGRWYPNGSSLEEGDVNNPSSESLIRQVMYGNDYFRKEFGVVSNEYMLPDCFGFPASLPSILAHCGVAGFSTQKLTWGSAVGVPFNVGVWNGPDGQGVVAALNALSYTTHVTDDLSHDTKWASRIDTDGQKSGIFADYGYYGAGDRGGAPDTPSVVNIEKSLAGGGPVHVVSSRASDMFTAITREDRLKLPRYSGDLLLTWHSAGSITSQAIMKRWNRKNELLADSAERASVAAALLGAEAYPSARLLDAWWRFLPGQFHDLLAGTAMPKAYEFTQNDEVIAANEFSDVLRESVGGVIRGLDTRATGTREAGEQAPVSFVVYNPLSIARSDVAEVTIPVDRSLVTNARQDVAAVVRGPQGDAVPSQVTKNDGSTATVIFLSRVPAVGFGTYHVSLVARERSTLPETTALQVTANSLENARYRVTLNDGGDIASIFDKKAKKELLSAPARLAFVSENPKEYPAWNMDWEDQSKPPRGYVDGPAAIRIAENGPARVALEVTRHAEGSTFVQTIRLSAGDAGNRVEIANKIDWRSAGCVLKAVLPLTVSNPNATYNWGIGTVQRPTNDPKKYEVPAHQWFDLTDTSGSYGVSVLEDCKNGSDKPDDHTLRLTLLYTPGVRGGFQHQASQDWGRHEFVYALDGHTGDWRAGNSQWEAARLNQPLMAFQVKPHEGKLGTSFSLLQVSNPAVQVEALKKAENSDEIIVRLNELTGTPVRGAHLKFAAPIESAREVNGQEQPLDGKPNVRNGELVVDMDPYRPRAFAIKLGKAPATLSAPSSASVTLPYDTNVTRAAGASASGAFDADGRSIPAEMLPESIESGNVTFKLASGGNNAVACKGQAVALPSSAGRRRLYILAAAYGGDTTAPFQVDGASPVNLNIQDWGGYVGQWDTRLWGGKVPELTYDWNNPLVGITPGFVKPATVAWYSDHWRLADGTNDPYKFCYLFRYEIDLPAGAKTLTLPNNEKVRIMAVSVADNPNDDATPAEPLSDTLADHPLVSTAPQIVPAGGQFTDSVPVTLQMPLYYAGKTEMHYTLDGSDPTAASPVAPADGFFVSRRATVKAVAVDSDGKVSPIASAPLDVSDHTPPTVTSAAVTGISSVEVAFSEPLARESAEKVANYAVKTPTSIAVASASLSPDARKVTLALASPLPVVAGAEISLLVHGVADQSPAGNPNSMAEVKVDALAPVITVASPRPFTGTGRGVVVNRQSALPIHEEQPWTINMFVYTDKQPEELTILGGFGDATDTTGAQRFLIKYQNGIHFWGSGVDISSGVPLDLGKWQMLTATCEGRTVRIYKNGVEIKSGDATFADALPVVKLGVRGPWDGTKYQFTGKISGFTVWKAALGPEFLKTLLAGMPAGAQ